MTRIKLDTLEVGDRFAVADLPYLTGTVTQLGPMGVTVRYDRGDNEETEFIAGDAEQGQKTVRFVKRARTIQIGGATEVNLIKE